MARVFFVAGEPSGDIIGAWYLRRRQRAGSVQTWAVGGSELAEAGAALVMPMTALSIVGITEVFAHLFRLWRAMRTIVAQIKTIEPDEIVLINFSSFNLLLAGLLKHHYPAAQRVFLSPPQLWVWGAWRVHLIRRWIDRVEVIFPFEVDWYARHRITAVWVGNPIVERCTALINSIDVPRRHQLLVLPGSRTQEVARMGPLFAQVAEKLLQQYPQLQVTWLQAAPCATMEPILKGLHEQVGSRFEMLMDLVQARASMQSAAVALAKPGTNTLELALLGVPAIVAYRVSWLTYVLARMVVPIRSMALPNLITKAPIYLELLQQDCSVDRMALEVGKLYESFCRQDDMWVLARERCAVVRAKMQ